MLAQLPTLKARLGLTDTVDDTLLQNLLALATGRFQRFCAREFGRTVNATFEFAGHEREILLPLYPVESVSGFALKANEADGFVTQTGIDYLLRRACVLSLAAPLGTGNEAGRVTYTGGYVLPGTAPGAGQTALPAELEHACVEQAAHWFANRHRFGLATVSADGGRISPLDPSEDLLPTVKQVLSSYRRMNA